MSEKTLRELRTIWTVATCEILDAHIKSVVASAMAERDPAKPAPDNFADSVNQVPKPEAGDWAMEEKNKKEERQAIMDMIYTSYWPAGREIWRAIQRGEHLPHTEKKDDTGTVDE